MDFAFIEVNIFYIKNNNDFHISDRLLFKYIIKRYYLNNQLKCNKYLIMIRFFFKNLF